MRIKAALSRVPVQSVCFARKWRGWLIVAGIIIGLPLILAVVGLIGSGIGEMKQRRYQRQLHSGEVDFRDQPQLLAVARAIDRNDENAVRAADFRHSAPDGTTLVRILTEHRKSYIDERQTLPAEYNALCEWLKSKG